MDTDAFEATGFSCRYSTLGAVHAFARSLRVHKAPGPAVVEFRDRQDLERHLGHVDAAAPTQGSADPA
jgi:hypothetical protein